MQNDLVLQQVSVPSYFSLEYMMIPLPPPFMSVGITLLVLVFKLLVRTESFVGFVSFGAVALLSLNAWEPGQVFSGMRCKVLWALTELQRNWTEHATHGSVSCIFLSTAVGGSHRSTHPTK